MAGNRIHRKGVGYYAGVLVLAAAVAFLPVGEIYAAETGNSETSSAEDVNATPNDGAESTASTASADNDKAEDVTTDDEQVSSTDRQENDGVDDRRSEDKDEETSDSFGTKAADETDASEADAQQEEATGDDTDAADEEAADEVVAEEVVEAAQPTDDGDPAMGDALKNGGEPDPNEDGIVIVPTIRGGSPRSGYASTAKVIDVSKHQASINWSSVKSAGYDYAIIRVGYRGYGGGGLAEDEYFRSNISGAINAGLQVGVYIFSQALNQSEAIEEANFLLARIGSYQITLPVFMDYEWTSGYRLERGGNASARTQTIQAFCDQIASAGYTAGVYGGDYQLSTSVNTGTLASKYVMWVANYSTMPRYYSDQYDLWQYTSTGRVSGISTNVDISNYYMRGSVAASSSGQSRYDEDDVDDVDDLLSRLASARTTTSATTSRVTSTRTTAARSTSSRTSTALRTSSSRTSTSASRTSTSRTSASRTTASRTTSSRTTSSRTAATRSTSSRTTSSRTTASTTSRSRASSSRTTVRSTSRASSARVASSLRGNSVRVTSTLRGSTATRSVRRTASGSVHVSAVARAASLRSASERTEATR